MSIVAQSADGTSHEFPDGTNPSVIDKVMKDYAQQIPKQPNSLIDAARSIPGGLAQGAAVIAGLPGTISDLMSSGLDAGMNYLTGNNISTAHSPLSGKKISDAISKPTGGYYKPQTTAGHYAETAASFAPALAGGEASLGARLMGRVLAPAAGAQLAGSAVSEDDHPLLHGALETGGALLGGGLVAGSRALGGALKDLKAPPETVANKYVAALAPPDTISANAIPSRGQLGAEAQGPQGVSALATLGRRGGDTGQALANALTARSIATPSRIMNDFASAAGIDPRAAQGNFDQILEAGTKKAEPLYKGAYAENQSVSSPAIDRILETPAGRKAMNHASQMMQNDQSLMGVANPDLLEQARESGQEIPWKGGVADGLKLRSLDYVKRALDDQIGAAYRSGAKTEGGILSGLKNRLLTELDNADSTAAAGPNSLKPEGGLYAQARSAAGDYLGAKQAFEDGQDHILSTTTSAADVAKYVAKLPPTALEAYKGGIANKLFLQAQNMRLAPKLLNTPAVQEKLSAAIGPDKAETFITGIKQEIDLAKSGARMMPNTNSPTFDLLNAAGDQDAAANVNAGIHGLRAAGHALSGNPLSAIGSGLTALKHFAPDLLKTGGMSPEARNAAGKLLMLPPGDLAAHLRSLPPVAINKRAVLSTLLKGGN